VYNRWGNPVYENLDGNKCWNGNAQNGEPLPSGVYYYIMKVKKREEAESTHYGTITLIRGND
jgi:gliding motility-associated-like protein